MGNTVTLADIEQLCWRLSGWKVQQRDVDSLLAHIRTYAAHPTGEPCPCTVRPYLTPGAVTEPPETPRKAATCTRPCCAPPPPRKRTTTAPRPMREAGTGPGRTCRVCKNRWTLEEFSRDTKGIDGRRNICRGCDYAQRMTRKAASSQQGQVTA